MFGFNKKRYADYGVYEENLKRLCELLGFGLSAGGTRILNRNENVGINLIHKKIDLILKHLELEYVPEKDTKEPAKLEKVIPLTTGGCASIVWFDESGEVPDSVRGVPPKKKRGRPKKK